MSKLIHNDPFQIIAWNFSSFTHFVNAPLVCFHFLSISSIPSKHSSRFVFKEIYIDKHSSIFWFCCEIKEKTSCAIHMHSGKSHNPVCCERAQVTPLIGPPTLVWNGASAHNPPVLTNLPKCKKAVKKVDIGWHWCSTHSWLLTWRRTSLNVFIFDWYHCLQRIQFSVAFKNSEKMYISMSRLCNVWL